MVTCTTSRRVPELSLRKQVTSCGLQISIPCHLRLWFPKAPRVVLTGIVDSDMSIKLCRSMGPCWRHRTNGISAGQLVERRKLIKRKEVQKGPLVLTAAKPYQNAAKVPLSVILGSTWFFPGFVCARKVVQRMNKIARQERRKLGGKTTSQWSARTNASAVYHLGYTIMQVDMKLTEELASATVRKIARMQSQAAQGPREESVRIVDRRPATAPVDQAIMPPRAVQLRLTATVPCRNTVDKKLLRRQLWESR